MLLILHSYDTDWNPSVDAQAAARAHRSALCCASRERESI